MVVTYSETLEKAEFARIEEGTSRKIKKYISQIPQQVELRAEYWTNF